MPQSPAAETTRPGPAARCAMIRREALKAFAPEVRRDRSTGLLLLTPTLLARATALHRRPALGIRGCATILRPRGASRTTIRGVARGATSPAATEAV